MICPNNLHPNEEDSTTIILDSPLDTLNKALFSVEIALNIIFIPIVCFLFYICVIQRNLHVSFRSMLFLTGFGYLICDIYRIIIAAARMCCISQHNTSFVSKLIFVHYFGLNISIFGLFFATIERAIATAFFDKYERRCTCFVAPTLLCGAVVLLSTLVCCTTTMRLSEYVDNVDIFFMGLQISVVVLSFVALAIIVIFNTYVYRKRHKAMMGLSKRYQLDENIRSGRYLIPVALNWVLVKVIFLLLMAYSIFSTDIPLGYDTTHLSHAYDLLAAYQRLFFGLALTIRSQTFERLLGREKKTMRAVEKQATASLDYFKHLQAAWS